MKKLNYFSPLPPLKSGISDYSQELLKELSKYFNITVYVDENYSPKKSEHYEIKKFGSKDRLDDTPCIYNIGNHHSHAYIYNLLQKKGGIVIIHDLNLHGLVFSMQKKYWSKICFLKEIFLNHGVKALIDYLKIYILLKSDYIKEESIYTKTNVFLSKGWNDKERDKNGSFIWTKKRADFMIRERNIEEITFKVQAELPTLLSIKINNKKRKFIVSRSIKNISINIPLGKEVNGNLLVTKPISILSNIIHRDKRYMGVKVYEIKYKKGSSFKNIELFKKNIHKIKKISPKFLELKEKIFFSYNMNKRLIKSSKAIIVHSNYLKEEITKINSKLPVIKINEGVYLNTPVQSKEKLRRKLKLEKYDFIICSFGKIQKHKQIETALESFKKFSMNNENSAYILIGEPDETIDIKGIIKRLKLKDNALLLGYLPFEKAVEYIRASDISINLRHPSTGATSASLIKSLSIGTPSIISDIPENSQFPVTCVFKIKKDVNEIDKIVEKLELLKKNKELTKKMSDNSIRYIKDNHLWKDKAKEISDYIKKIYKIENENSNC